ncbi:glutathione S-transferase family protein [Neptuniibacter sp.]|uniref:glutathione S-transferase family protein n=1 Tax=Neptuniibacter sp. TaxID=1962643 RepID=UPI00261C59ED|nr:glutathione S-transferase family protein [Neptuniibacter sp.]MCP4597654.1 glutathione S-transferase family protein [Neptuniibacter sp.]
MIKVYGSVFSRASMVMCVLETLNLEYEYIPYLPKGKEIKQDEFLALNPNGKVPALVDGDLVLWETQAILVYLVDKYGDGALWANTAEERADILRWSLFVSNQLELFALDLFLQNKFVPEELRDEAIILRAQAELDKHLPVLNNHLEGREFVSGTERTIADIHGATILSWAKLVGYNFKQFPNVDAWIKSQIKSVAQQKVNAKA